MIARLGVLATCVIACAGKPRAPVAPGTPPPAAATEAPAAAAFRAYTARRLHVAPRKIEDDSASIIGLHTRGAATAYMMTREGILDTAVRGWAIADGTVITPNHNLGILFAEAGVWSAPAPPALAHLAHVVADDLVWSYGPDGEVEPDGHGMTAPRLALAADGSGTLRFFSRSDSDALDPEQADAADAGGGGAAQFYFENKVALTSDHRATLTRALFQLPPD